MTNNNEGDHKLSLEEENTDSLFKHNLNDTNELTTTEGSVNVNMNYSVNNLPTVKNSLKFASLNLCGLNRRVLFPEFQIWSVSMMYFVFVKLNMISMMISICQDMFFFHNADSKIHSLKGRDRHLY